MVRICLDGCIGVEKICRRVVCCIKVDDWDGYLLVLVNKCRFKNLFVFRRLGRGVKDNADGIAFDFLIKSLDVLDAVYPSVSTHQ